MRLASRPAKVERRLATVAVPMDPGRAVRLAAASSVVPVAWERADALEAGNVAVDRSPDRAQ